ncbi:hypothetical protein COLO4_08421 [Corchorus olitorius]|uniref:Uncharacterized protein n=1 Tax=Corchorus olitorius TaxID=93759 RepID=A0A1R3KFW2_9ROSI|nr:hypothetical protein COLO4_08421 [Corchorus olitorius]
MAFRVAFYILRGIFHSTLAAKRKVLRLTNLKIGPIQWSYSEIRHREFCSGEAFSEILGGSFRRNQSQIRDEGKKASQSASFSSENEAPATLATEAQGGDTGGDGG